MSFDSSSSIESSGSTIPTIDNSQLTTENVGVGMYPSLMGSFNIIAPIMMIGSTLGIASSSLSLVPFKTMYLEDSWTLPPLSILNEDTRPTKLEMSLSTMEIAYQAGLDPVVDPSPSSS